jgi:hypothetical protein
MKKSWMNYVLLTSLAVLLMLAPLWLTPLYELIVGRPMDRGLPPGMLLEACKSHASALKLLALCSGAVMCVGGMLLGTASTYLVGNGVRNSAQQKRSDRIAPVLMILTGLACTIFAMDSVNENYYGQPLADNQYITVDRWMELTDGTAPLQDSNNIVFCCQSMILGPLLFIWGIALFWINSGKNGEKART